MPKLQKPQITPMPFSPQHLQKAQSRKDLIQIAQEENIPVEKALEKVNYEEELALLQSELVNLQQ